MVIYWDLYIYIYISGWWYVSTPLKNMEIQLGWLLTIYWKIKHVPNHQPGMAWNILKSVADFMAIQRWLRLNSMLKDFLKDWILQLYLFWVLLSNKSNEHDRYPISMLWTLQHSQNNKQQWMRICSPRVRVDLMYRSNLKDTNISTSTRNRWWSWWKLMTMGKHSGKYKQTWNH